LKFSLSKAHYLEWLKEYADKTNCKIHAYVLMTNHVHLLVSTDEAKAVGVMMKALDQHYVQYINRSYRRSGSLWEGRYRSCPTQADTYPNSSFIEQKPQRFSLITAIIDFKPLNSNYPHHPFKSDFASTV
jgi:putative transposase